MQQNRDYDCPICLEICVDPIILKECQHMLCSACMMNLLDQNNQDTKCPLCRISYLNNEPLVVDQDLCKKIEQTNPILYAERKEQIKLLSIIPQNEIEVKIAYGNNFRQIKCINKKNTTEWSMFVRIDYTKETDREALKNLILNDLIESVTYYLHPNSKPNVITVTKSPFIMTQQRLGNINIPILIKFKQQYNIPNLQVEHCLSFHGEGLTLTKVIKLDITNLKQSQELHQEQLENLQQQQIQQ